MPPSALFLLSFTMLGCTFCIFIAGRVSARAFRFSQSLMVCQHGTEARKVA
jgi:hypothetical protein